MNNYIENRNDLLKMTACPSYIKDGVSRHFSSYQSLEWDESPIGYSFQRDTKDGTTLHASWDCIERHLVSLRSSS
jgi:hypothetical protein